MDTCPMGLLDAMTWMVIDAAEVAMDHGLLPVGGGTLDQVHAFNAATRWVMSEKWRYESELGVG